MICLIALIVFGILGIFSVSHRALAKEAFRCVFRRVTLRKCDTGFDQKMKAKITGKLMSRSPRLARFTYKNFEAISFVFTILLISSMAYSGYGIYNLVNYGSCDPHSEFCIFNPEGGVSCGGKHCELDSCTCGGKEENCTPENLYAACKGDCDCLRDICGG